MAEASTLYKLIILYMLRKVTFPLTNAQITEFIVGKEYTDYFERRSAILRRIRRRRQERRRLSIFLI